MIVLNFAPAPPITERQKQQIVASVVAHLDPRFNTAPEIRVIDVPQASSAKATFDACGLSADEWCNEAFAHRIPEEHPFRDALLYELERRCGYNHVEIRGKR